MGLINLEINDNIYGSILGFGLFLNHVDENFYINYDKKHRSDLSSSFFKEYFKLRQKKIERDFEAGDHDESIKKQTRKDLTKNIKSISINLTILKNLEEGAKFLKSLSEKYRNEKLTEISDIILELKKDFNDCIEEIKSLSARELEILEIEVKEVDLNASQNFIKHLASKSQLQSARNKYIEGGQSESPLDSQISSDSGFNDEISSEGEENQISEISDEEWFNLGDDHLELASDKDSEISDDDEYFYFDDDENLESHNQNKTIKEDDIQDSDNKAQKVEYYKNTKGEIVENKSFKIKDLINREFAKKALETLKPLAHYEREKIDNRSFLHKIYDDLEKGNTGYSDLADIVSNKYNYLTNLALKTTKDIGWQAGKGALGAAYLGFTAIKNVQDKKNEIIKNVQDKKNAILNVIQGRPNANDATSNVIKNELQKSSRLNAIQSELNKKSETSNTQSNNANHTR